MAFRLQFLELLKGKSYPRRTLTTTAARTEIFLAAFRIHCSSPATAEGRGLSYPDRKFTDLFDLNVVRLDKIIQVRCAYGQMFKVVRLYSIQGFIREDAIEDDERDFFFLEIANHLSLHSRGIDNGWVDFVIPGCDGAIEHEIERGVCAHDNDVVPVHTQVHRIV